MSSDFSGGPGFAAFVATFALVAVAVLLFRSLSKHLRKVRTHPPVEPSRPSDGDGNSEIVADESRDR